MKKIVSIYFFLTLILPSCGQKILTLEGQKYINTNTSVWVGINIPREEKTLFMFKNNSIVSYNNQGYLLQAGDENPAKSNGMLDGSIITGNKFTWNGKSGITHGIFTGYSKNVLIKYNYCDGIPMGAVRKSNGGTNTSGGVAYNIFKNNLVGAVAKGINNVLIYNNTFYCDKTADENWRGQIMMYANDGLTPTAPSTGTKVKNNIFYTKYQIYNITIEDTASIPPVANIDYNLYYCETGTPIFNYLGRNKTFAQWQAIGFDAHSVVVDPDFNNITDFVPSSRLDYGTNLGETWEAGLATNALWVVNSTPAMTNQGIIWQVGAKIYESRE